MFRKLRAMMYATYPQMVKKKIRGVGVCAERKRVQAREHKKDVNSQ